MMKEELMEKEEMASASQSAEVTSTTQASSNLTSTPMQNMTTQPPSIEDTSKPSAASTYPPTTTTIQALDKKPEPKAIGAGLRALGGLGLGLPTGNMNAAPSRPQIMPLGNMNFGDPSK